MSFTDPVTDYEKINSNEFVLTEKAFSDYRRFVYGRRQSSRHTRVYKRQTKTAHLIGIGGVSMCSLAETLLESGHKITGSDMKNGSATKSLSKRKVKIFIGHFAENVRDADYIIRSAAIKDDNPEIAEARRLGIPVYSRAEGWGALMQRYKNAVCVSGTHGKTTTTSMLTHIAMAASADPTVMIGGSPTPYRRRPPSRQGRHNNPRSL